MEQSDTDKAIKALLADDDQSALDLIWDAYASDLLGYLISIHRSRHEAEDTLQEVFVTIARKRRAVAEADHLKAYLMRLSRNVALNQIKKQKRRRDREQEAGPWLAPKPDRASEDMRAEYLEAAINKLPVKQRTVIVLKFFQGKTLREIGEMLGISENTAGSRYRYAMTKLKNTIKGAI